VKRTVSLGQLGLWIEPTPAMERGDQTVWQHSHCGTVVVSPSGRPKPGACPCCERPDAPWWTEEIPVAGLRRVAA
jgi:hypothetical protein